MHVNGDWPTTHGRGSDYPECSFKFERPNINSNYAMIASFTIHCHPNFGHKKYQSKRNKHADTKTTYKLTIYKKFWNKALISYSKSKVYPLQVQTVGIVIVLPFHDHDIRWGECSAARPGRTLPPVKSRYPMYRRLGSLQGRAGRGKNSPHRDSISGTSSP
jgi:hypothetical protein